MTHLRCIKVCVQRNGRKKVNNTLIMYCLGESFCDSNGDFRNNSFVMYRILVCPPVVNNGTLRQPDPL